MRYIHITLCALCIILLNGIPNFVIAAEEFIAKYDIDITVLSAEEILIEESILYNFGTTPNRHGIYREIPNVFVVEGKKYRTFIDWKGVTDYSGKPVPYVDESSSNIARIRIGDADKNISGYQEYKILYSAKNSLIPISNDRAQLYWNAIGTEWNIPIQDIAVTASVPDVIPEESFCYVGGVHSEVPCNLNESIGRTVSVQHPSLQAYEGISLQINFDTASIGAPELMAHRSPWWTFIILTKVLLGLLGLAYFRWGREPRDNGPVVTQFSPPDEMSPLEAGLVYDESLESRDMTAGIINLAHKGFLRIEKSQKKSFGFTVEKYTLLSTEKEITDSVSSEERELFDIIFNEKSEVSMEELGSSFAAQKGFSNLRKHVREAVKEKGLLESRPEWIWIVILMVVFAGLFMVLPLQRVWAYVFGVYESQVVAVFGSLFLVYMILISMHKQFFSKRTIKGVRLKKYLDGLKGYMTIAEKDRYDFHYAPENNPQKFEELLPYAIAFGVEKKWAKKFEGMLDQSPGWYSDTTGAAFSVSHMTQDIKNSVGGFAGSSSSEGGSSGGGSGGGGGGSW